MSDFNIRDYRGAHQSNNSASEPQSKKFGILAVSIPILAAVIGLAYNPVMEMRQSHQGAMQRVEAEIGGQGNLTKDDAVNILKAAKGQAQAAADAKRVMASLPKDPETGLIDLNRKAAPTEASLYRDKMRRDGLPVRDYLKAIDAKHEGFTKDEMKVLRYDRAKSALSQCGYRDLSNFYAKSNKSRYQKLSLKLEALAKENAVEIPEIETSELSKIETKSDAMKFVASGGAQRHQEQSMQMFAGLSGMMADQNRMKVKQRKQRHGAKTCMKIRTMAQSGELNI